METRIRESLDAGTAVASANPLEVLSSARQIQEDRRSAFDVMHKHHLKLCGSDGKLSCQPTEALQAYAAASKVTVSKPWLRAAYDWCTGFARHRHVFVSAPQKQL